MDERFVLAWHQFVQVSVLTLVCFILGACASNPPATEIAESGVEAPATSDEAQTSDPLEPFNRAMFGFNDTLDRWFLKPVAKGYRWVLPKPVRSGVGNFFSNLGNVTSIANSGLQWKWKKAAHYTGRLVINSTVGVGGLVDVASSAGLEKEDPETFNQTLAVWGVPRGAYLVLPLLGPNTVRGTPALVADYYTSPNRFVDPDEAEIALGVLDVIHTRSELLDLDELVTGDKYIFVREAYLQRLEFLETDGEKEDDFGAGFDDEYGYE